MVPANVCKSLIHDQIIQRVKWDVESQKHGFFSARSVQTNLKNFTFFFTESLDKIIQVDTISLNSTLAKIFVEIIANKLRKNLEA